MPGIMIRGRAVPFNTPETDARKHGLRSMIVPGAFLESIRRCDEVSFFMNHRTSNIASTEGSAGGMLYVGERSDGLHFTADIEDPMYAGMITDAFAGGLVRGVSISWSSHLAVEEPRATSGLLNVRKARLLEISLLTGSHEPAFPDTFARLSCWDGYRWIPGPSAAETALDMERLAIEAARADALAADAEWQRAVETNAIRAGEIPWR